MNTNPQLKQMQNYIAETLHSTGEFNRIDIGYNFKEESIAPSLQTLAKRHIYCEIKPEYKGTKFLIITDPDHMDGPLFAKKLEAASRLGIYTLHVLYRYTNPLTKKENQGPLFRRFVLEEERKKGDVKYRKKAAFMRDSLSHYAKKQRDNFRILRLIEREWVNNIANGFPIYYQPKSVRLEEMLKRYKFKDVVFKGKDGFGKYRTETSKEIKDPELIEDLAFFTIQPMRQKLNQKRLKFNLEQTIKENKRPYRFDSGKLLIADLVALPRIDVKNDDESLVRHNIGLLGYAYRFGLGQDAIDDLIERIGIQTDSWNKNHLLLKEFNKVMGYEQKEEKNDYKKFSIEKIIKKSESKPGEVHYIAKKTNLETGEITYTCSCNAYKYSKKPKHCKHIDEQKEIDALD